MKTKPVQMSVEQVLETKRAEAKRLTEEADRLEAEMQRILSEPPTSRLIEAYKNGHTMTRMAEENANTIPAGPPSSVKMLAEREVLYAALAIVRSWRRRHKKNWHSQEKELAAAVERLTWEK